MYLKTQICIALRMPHPMKMGLMAWLWLLLASLSGAFDERQNAPAVPTQLDDEGGSMLQSTVSEMGSISTVSGMDPVEQAILLQSAKSSQIQMMSTNSIDHAEDLQTKLQQAVENRVNSKSTAPLDATIASAIDAQFILLYAELVKEQVQQQAEATASNDGIKACNTQKSNTFSAAGSGVDALVILANSAKTTHSQCRVAEKSNIATQVSECQAYHSQATSAHITAPTCSCAYTASGARECQK